MFKVKNLKRKSSEATMYFVISVILIVTFSLVGISTIARAQANEVIEAVRYTQNEIIEPVSAKNATTNVVDLILSLGN